METRQQIRHYCQQFRMNGIQSELDELIKDAEDRNSGYLEFTVKVLQAEVTHRERNDLSNLLRVAKLPPSCVLTLYDHGVDNGLTKSRMNQLKELNWLDQVYTVILMGPSGTGKTYRAAGLCAEAVNKGYKAYFRTMDELITMLKMKEITRTAKGDYKGLCKADLIVIDDIMLFPVEKATAVTLFNFINQLYEKTSFIITTNKKPAEWAKMSGDEVLATALLDRLLYRCEITNLSGKSYRIQNRKTIFSD
ncbi:IS21-like element helper ATPase IstB [Flavihumibacter sp. RY-1]|uniref:IS21-like element helper ATPase IstB n=1 Tax=Flavihumibacter fluminis TaxID=2909236 RepID=A0ABS9BPR5_9BACT|nr:IS21-like element helper ATPase IstB [Flavihumibacter fluminis]MCF1717052.1 IS21-like element helper ATPase IstB [Flavihumibacter fluminis]